MTNSNGIGISVHQLWIGRSSPAAFRQVSLGPLPQCHFISLERF